MGERFCEVLLAAVGLYIVLSFEIGTRTREFGVRMALGSNRVKVVSQVIRESLVHETNRDRAVRLPDTNPKRPESALEPTEAT